jgi:hypothetical protein
MSKLRGGEASGVASTLELYWPSSTQSTQSGINPNVKCQQNGGEWFGPSQGCLKDGKRI